MALIDPRRALIGTILFLLASQGAAQKSADLTAILTQIEGQVTVSSASSSASREEFRSVRRASQRQILRRGEVVHVPSGAQAALICSTETLVSLTGPRDWILDATACGQGLPLPESSYRNLASYAGRILPRNGALLLELETRNGEVGLGPILLSPRNTAVMDACPLLVWTRVSDAAEYEIEVRGPVATSIRLAAGDLHCGHGSGPWHDLDVCSWVPSGKWPALVPETPVFLRFGSRQALTASLRQVREVYQIHRLPVNDQRSVQEVLRQIAGLPLDKASRLLLTAGAYAQGGLYADAITSYSEALQAKEMPEARVTLGDLYLAIGLTALADREYRQVLAGAPDAAAQAAAELGLGQAAYSRKLFSDARAHFERAHELYTTLDLPAEAEAARAAAAIAAPSLR
ncbi:MAG: tetratricopeptide repeat protein [Thermoanaerobaculia bacterium]